MIRGMGLSGVRTPVMDKPTPTIVLQASQQQTFSSAEAHVQNARPVHTRYMEMHRHVHHVPRIHGRRWAAPPKLAACAMLGILWLLNAGTIHVNMRTIISVTRHDMVIAKILRLAPRAQTKPTALPSARCHARRVLQARTRT